MTAPLRLWSGGAVKSGLIPAIELYRRHSGAEVAVEFLPMGPLAKRLAEPLPDALILTRELMDRAMADERVAAGAPTEIGRVAIGIAVRDKAPVPDVSTAEALKRALLAAKSVVYIDPERGTSGQQVAVVLETLGIAEAVRAKAVLGQGGSVVEPVARGEVELGIHQITEILNLPGVRFAGPLPGELQKETVYLGAATATTARGAEVRVFLAFLRSAEIRALFASKGFIERV
jgi:molybdate transport system substrate-binding protein